MQAYIAAMPAGSATSAAASTRSSSAPSLTCARRSNGTRRFMASRMESGSSVLLLHQYVKVAFFPRAALRPVPPGESNREPSLPHIHET